ncbi:hypothetical protein QWA68_002636, partial [Fusarium oxysporum]
RQAVEGNFAVGVHYQAVYGKTVWEPPLGRLNSLYQHRLGQEFMAVIHIVMGNQYYIFLLAHTVYRPPDVLTHSTQSTGATPGALNERLRIVATLPKPYTMKHTMLPVVRRRTTGGIVVSDDHNAANNDIDTELDLSTARSELSHLAQMYWELKPCLILSIKLRSKPIAVGMLRVSFDCPGLVEESKTTGDM